jgi:hypothetical protein
MAAVLQEDPPVDESVKASVLEEMIEKYLQHPTDDKTHVHAEFAGSGLLKTASTSSVWKKLSSA